MIVNARPLSQKEKPPEPELPYVVIVTAKDGFNVLNKILNSFGQLLVDDVKITEDNQKIQTSKNELKVEYTLSRKLNAARQVVVNGAVLGNVKEIGDFVRTILQKTDSISVDFQKVN